MTKSNWRGNEVKSNMARASMLSIDATMSAAVIHARGSHGAGARGSGRFESQSGELERGTRIVQSAKRTSKGIVGRWGVIGVVYARRIELGFQGKDRAGRSIKSPALPFLRPAAKAEYPKLAGRLRKAANLA